MVCSSTFFFQNAVHTVQTTNSTKESNIYSSGIFTIVTVLNRPERSTIAPKNTLVCVRVVQPPPFNSETN